MRSDLLCRAALLFALAVAGGAAADEVELWWITAGDGWAVAADAEADAESFVTWLRNKDARRELERAAEGWREAMAQRDAAPAGAERWRGAFSATVLEATGGSTVIRRVARAGNPSSHAGLALSPQRKGTALERGALVVAVEAVIARDGRSFELELTVGERIAGSKEVARLREVRFLSKRVADPAAWDHADAYLLEIDAAAAFAVKAALGRATPGDAAGRRVRESGGGMLVSEPIEQ
jgi:hypothetical protein